MATVKDRLTALKDTLGVKLNALYDMVNQVEIALSNFKEEDIFGTAVDSYLNGVNTLDLSLVSHYNIAVAENSTVTFSGFPALGKSFTRTGTVISATGVETLSFANATNEFGSYDPTKINFITVMVSNTNAVGVVINVFYAQPN